eukprot:8691522-Pyramimonas_sp.AAC.1
MAFALRFLIHPRRKCVGFLFIVRRGPFFWAACTDIPSMEKYILCELLPVSMLVSVRRLSVLFSLATLTCTMHIGFGAVILSLRKVFS